jgi:hypothetical protein
MATYYTSDDYGDQITDAAQDDDTGTQWDLQGNSRIGVRVKGELPVSGRIELGLNDVVPGGGTVSTRLIYGTWDFGAGKLKIGKDYTPVSQFISGQVFAADLGLLGIGTYYGLRQGQASLSFGNFEVALVTQNDDTIESAPAGYANINYVGPDPGAEGVDSGGDPDSYIPKVEAKWGMSHDSWSFNIMGGFQYYEIEDVVSLDDGDTNDVDVTSWVIGGDVGFNFGPGYIKAAVSYDQNGGNGGWYSLPGAWDEDDDIKDSNVLQAALVGGFKMSDMVTFEAGFGIADQKTDVKGLDDTTPWALYGQAVIGMAPGVYIIPEVGYFDWDSNGDDDDDDLGKQFYLGAKWQIDF